MLVSGGSLKLSDDKQRSPMEVVPHDPVASSAMGSGHPAAPKGGSGGQVLSSLQQKPRRQKVPAGLLFEHRSLQH